MSYEERRERARRALCEQGLDALLVSYASNRYYLSGFELHDVQLNESAGYLVLTKDGRDLLCTDGRYVDAARRLWNENDIVIYKGEASTALNEILKGIGGKIGFESTAVSASFVMDVAPGLTLEPADGIVDDLRVIKDADEIAALRTSFALNHAMLKWAPGILKEGMTESELAWEIEKYFRENGASELAFPSIVAFGPNGALPHAVPGDTRLQPEMAVLLDVGCRVNSYCSDQTRSFWYGEHESDEFSRVRDLVAEAQQTAIRGLRPGLSFVDAYNLAMGVFEREGCGAYFTHGLGHGVGLDTHEAPRLSPRSEGVLAPGMTVTVEPGLYYSGRVGVRLEYTMLITEDGAEIL